MSIPTSITADHVTKAIEKLKSGVEHDFGASVRYDVMYEGEPYAPKAVIGTTAEIATGVRLDHSSFHGGESHGPANPFLRSLEFKIVAKKEKLVTVSSRGPKSERDRI